METILFLAYTENDGSLGKAALESLALAQDLTTSLAALFLSPVSWAIRCNPPPTRSPAAPPNGSSE